MNVMSTTGLGYDKLRRRHATEAMTQLPEQVARMDWTAAQIQTEREQRLQRLLALARARSPWHRARLAGVDLSNITPAGLGQLPPMTKDDLLAHFDEIVTDPRLTLGVVEDHLSG
jgi:phenylacetate-coenzyme A ligase PaaK-like adenylate-forming protein